MKNDTLFWLNFLLFQWFFCRLAVLLSENEQTKEYELYDGIKFIFAFPLAKWDWKTFKYLSPR